MTEQPEIAFGVEPSLTFKVSMSGTGVVTPPAAAVPVPAEPPMEPSSSPTPE